MKNEKLTICQDWNHEGSLKMTNTMTIGRYKELLKSTSEMTQHEKQGIFFAFTNEDFDREYDRIKHLLADGEKVCSFGAGMYGVRSYIKEYLDRIANVNKVIAEECDPQEVYCFEYNNHECMFGHDGDEPAFKIVKRIFGEDADSIQRWSVMQ